MKNLKFPVVCSILLSGTLIATAAPKTKSPAKIDPSLINKSPYRFNGLVLTDVARGSGFCAWNQRTFFSAAHVVYDEGVWGAPPVWVPTVNADDLPAKDSILSRGYYRLNRYAEIASEEGVSSAFGEDVMLAFAFRKLIPGKPAKLNLKGSSDLRDNGPKLITGYPAVKVYTDTPTDGLYMYETGPFRKSFSRASGESLETTLVSTGPGNSGGPVWTEGPNKKWEASGILVGGLPSECVVYSFSREVTPLLRAAARVVGKKKPQTPKTVRGVSASTLFFPYYKSRKLPDATDKWSSFSVNVKGFGDLATLTSVKLDLAIKTKHRGDLQVYVVAPGGYSAVLQNEEGAGENDLVYKNLDLTESFTGIDPEGKWSVRVRDRLKGDIATLKSFRLEVSADPASGTIPTP